MRILWAFKSSFLAILMPGIILGGILFGIVTPTEAAAIAVFYALFIGVVVYRALSLSRHRARCSFARPESPASSF